MVLHLVTWTLHPEADGRDARANAALIQQQIEALVGVVPGLRSARVGWNARPGPGTADVGLVSEHDDWAALDVYANHPAHVLVKDFVGKVARERRAVDFERVG